MKKIPRGVYWPMIVFPLFLVITAGVVLTTNFFPSLTFLDLAVFYVLGWISGVGTMLAARAHRNG